MRIAPLDLIERDVKAIKIRAFHLKLHRDKDDDHTVDDTLWRIEEYCKSILDEVERIREDEKMSAES